ncbi:hypothetical protein, partial [Bacteroides pyogenes]|uniref:hypothetical protein n=1 Tax=Bacteroides pyogenes TaxID=310300 RepID=UPI001E513CBF
MASTTAASTQVILNPLSIHSSAIAVYTIQTSGIHNENPQMSLRADVVYTTQTSGIHNSYAVSNKLLTVVYTTQTSG